jgi:cytochrome c-type biogenesis protein CcmH
LVGQAGELLERALQIDPRSDRALFYGGAAALRRGELPLARQRFATLLELNPPEQIRPLLQEQITAIDRQLGNAPTGPVAANGAGDANAQGNASNGANGANPHSSAGGGANSASAQAANNGNSPRTPSAMGGDDANRASMQASANGNANGASANGAASNTAASSGPAAVHINVTISPKLSAGLPAGAPLFVFVRDPNRPGPPLAVKRLTNRFPQSVELTSADAMVPGRELTAGQQVQVVARIAKSGTPTAQSGDPFGEVGYHVGRDKVVDIVIDRLTP